MGNRLRVVMLVNEFWPLPAGGAERQAQRLSRQLARNGLDIVVVTRHACGLPIDERKDGYRIYRAPSPGFQKLRTVSFMVTASWFLFRNRRRFDIAHAHLAYAPALVAVTAARLLGKRAVVKYGLSGRLGDIQDSRRTWRGTLRLALLRRWTHIHIALDAVTEAELRDARFPPDRIRRIRNGIDASEFTRGTQAATARDALGVAHDDILVLFAGRLTPQKALPALLTGFAEAYRRCLSLRLMILGQGPEEGVLRRQAGELALTDRISFVGHVADVRPYLQVANVFVNPSESEGISNALLEAMATGVPCIATAAGGSLDLLDNGRCGIVLDCNEPAEVCRAVLAVVDEPERARQLGARAQERIRTCYDFSVVGKQYEALYREMLSLRSGEPPEADRDG